MGPYCDEMVAQGLNPALRQVFMAFLCVCVCLIALMFKSQKFLPKNYHFCFLLKEDLVTLGPHSK